MIPRLALRFVVVFFCVWVSTAAAQETTGTILGTVTDASGGVLPSVTISVKHLETSQVRSVATDSGGRYRVQALLVGSYEITAAASGVPEPGAIRHRADRRDGSRREHHDDDRGRVPSEKSVLVAAVDVAADDGYASGR